MCYFRSIWAKKKKKPGSISMRQKQAAIKSNDPVIHQFPVAQCLSIHQHCLHFSPQAMVKLKRKTKGPFMTLTEIGKHLLIMVSVHKSQWV